MLKPKVRDEVKATIAEESSKTQLTSPAKMMKVAVTDDAKKKIFESESSALLSRPASRATFVAKNMIPDKNTATMPGSSPAKKIEISSDIKNKLSALASKTSIVAPATLSKVTAIEDVKKKMSDASSKTQLTSPAKLMKVTVKDDVKKAITDADNKSKVTASKTSIFSNVVKEPIATSIIPVKKNTPTSEWLDDAIALAEAREAKGEITKLKTMGVRDTVEKYGTAIAVGLSGSTGKRVAEEAAAEIEASGGPKNATQEGIVSATKSSKSDSESKSESTSKSSSDSKSSSGSQKYTSLSQIDPDAVYTAKSGNKMRGSEITSSDLPYITGQLEQSGTSTPASASKSTSGGGSAETPTNKESGLLTRGSNTYKLIREVAKDDIEPRATYLITRENGKQSVLSGNSLLGVSIKGDYKLTKVELVEGTPTYESNSNNINRAVEEQPVIKETVARTESDSKYGSTKGISYIYNFYTPVDGQSVTLSSDRPLSDEDVESRANEVLGITWDKKTATYKKTADTVASNPQAAVNKVKTLGKTVNVMNVNGKSYVTGEKKSDIVTSLPFGKTLQQLKDDPSYQAEKNGLLKYMGEETVDLSTEDLIASAGSPITAATTLAGIVSGESAETAWKTASASVYAQTARGQELVDDMAKDLAAGTVEYDAAKKSKFSDITMTDTRQANYFLTYATDEQIDEVYNNNKAVYSKWLQDANLNTLAKTRLGQSRVSEVANKYKLDDINYTAESLSSMGVNLGTSLLLDANLVPRNDAVNTLLLGVNVLTLPVTGVAKAIVKTGTKDVIEGAAKGSLKSTIEKTFVKDATGDWVTKTVAKGRTIIDSKDLAKVTDIEAAAKATDASTIAKSADLTASKSVLAESESVAKASVDEGLQTAAKVTEQDAGAVAAVDETPYTGVEETPYSSGYASNNNRSSYNPGNSYQSDGSSYYSGGSSSSQGSSAGSDVTSKSSVVESYSDDLGTLVRQSDDGSIAIYDEKSKAWLGSDDYVKLQEARAKVAAEEAETAAETETSSSAAESVADTYSSRNSYYREPSAATVEQSGFYDGSTSQMASSPTVVEVADSGVESTAKVSTAVERVGEKIASDMTDAELLAQKAEATDPVNLAEHAENLLAVVGRRVQAGGTKEEIKDLLLKVDEAKAKIREAIKVCKI